MMDAARSRFCAVGVFLVLVCFCLTANSQSTLIATTEDGKSVALFPDGTWVYITKPSDQGGSSATATLPINATATLENRYGRYNLHYDPSKWYLDDDLNDDAEFQLSHETGDGYAMTIFERTEIPLKNLTKIALDNLRAFDPKGYIDEEFKKTVNGTEVTVLTMRGSYEGIEFVYYGYYASGEWGSLQAIAYTSRNLFDEYKYDFTELLDGLVITN